MILCSKGFLIILLACVFFLGYINGLLTNSFTKVSVYKNKIRNRMKLKAESDLNTIQNSIECGIQCSRVRFPKNCTGFYFEKKKCKLVSMSINDLFIPIFEERFWTLPKHKIHLYLEEKYVTPALVFEPLPDLGNPKRIWNPSCGLTPGAEVHFFLELSSASSQHPLTEQIDLVGIQLGNLYLLLIGLGQAKLYTLKPSTTAEVPSDMDSTTNNYNPTKLIHFTKRVELKLNTKQGFWIQWISGQISFGYDTYDKNPVIFDILPDFEDEIMKQTNYEPSQLIDYLDFSLWNQSEVKGSFYVDQNCLEGTNFRELPPHDPEWSKVVVYKDQMLFLKPDKDQYNFNAKVVKVNEESIFIQANLFISIQLKNETEYLIAMPIHHQNGVIRILELPQLSWPNSTNFENSVLAQIQSAKLEALLDEYNDTEMSTEEKNSDINCSEQYTDFTCSFALTFHGSNFTFSTLERHFRVSENNSSLGGGFHQANIARLGLAVNCQNCLAIWKTRTSTLMSEDGNEHEDT